MRDLELLAPARNADIGIAAIDCGADAVYMAGPEFGARQNAGNSMDDVRRVCAYAHRFGVRIFLTVNTILFDDELPEVDRLLAEARDAGVDAVIAQDLAVFEALRPLRQAQGPVGEPAEPPQIHASTQCAIRTPEQAKFYESLGASRLVLERQLSLDQIRAIREAVYCELEFFVHGALCVCYSGQCYMSEAIEGRSANRGACIQACRSLYDLVDGNGKTLVKDKALLSLKDYNLIGRLEDLAEAGICSFKIEGRLKNISYVRNVVKAYSEALDKLVEKYPDKYRRTSFGKPEGGFVPDPGKTFNRGYTELFLDGKRGKWSSMDTPKSVGQPVGTVSKISTGDPRGGPGRDPGAIRRPAFAPEIMQVQVALDNPAIYLRNGDGFSFVSKDHNNIIGFRADTCRGARIIARNVPELYVGARLYRNLDTSFEKDLSSLLPIRRIPVSVDLVVIGSLDGSPGTKLQVTAQSQDGRLVTMEADAGDRFADNQQRMAAMFESQIGKGTGIYSFSLRELNVLTPGRMIPLMPSSAINAIRRELAAKLDGMPCRMIPMAGPSTSPGTGSFNTVAKEITYKANVSNKVARKVLERLGAGTIEGAYELSHKKEAELMRSKYCIRHELGLCRGDRGPLFLVNNGKRYRLDFDCAACEMTVKTT